MTSFLPEDLTDPDILGVSEFIKNRLYFITYYQNKIPEGTKNLHFFTTNDDFTGDENSEIVSRISLGTIFKFINVLNKKLTQEKYKEKIIVNYTSGSERKRRNGAVLIGAYAMTRLQMSPEQVADKLSTHSLPSPIDFLKAMEKAISFGFINFYSFNAEDFYNMDDVKLNWIVPNKLLMFNGPLDASNERYLSPRRYIKIFRYMEVQTIIRICHVKYDANPFVGADYPHYDINIAGSIPTDEVLEAFLELTEECEGVVLIHCREYLGRAGCLAGAYLVKHFRLSAEEAVAWMRLCTSECILEAQKNWLKDKEATLQKAGELHKMEGKHSNPCISICAYRSQEVQSSDKENMESSNFDVTAQLENEIKVEMPEYQVA
ncbi:dual specificity protein phosphatase CDC14AB-like [Macrosteles quadrilineatus]|uniref:dual specificity protein phosphatase CDC14AB-like n=1 Tax=Macrosteles quadrilineatus TaxID=74068 RepID=UPI0023E1F0D7|nr:dual specificity protein phosphatase CDC14AB-like [Macrosteles quadrilineatus]